MKKVKEYIKENGFNKGELIITLIIIMTYLLVKPFIDEYIIIKYLDKFSWDKINLFVLLLFSLVTGLLILFYFKSHKLGLLDKLAISLYLIYLLDPQYDVWTEKTHWIAQIIPLYIICKLFNLWFYWSKNEKRLSLWETDQYSEVDNLGREKFVEDLKRVITSFKLDSCLTIGLTARWGEGKTSLLKRLELKLRLESKNIEIIYFSVLKYSCENSIKAGFLNKVEKKLPISWSAKKKIEKYIQHLQGVDNKIFNISIIKNYFRINNQKDNLEEVRNSLKASKKRFLFIIDDLDRLDKEQTKAFLKFLKGVLDFPKSIFILAYDEKILQSYFENDEKNYLDKFVQIKYNLHSATPGALFDQLKLMFELKISSILDEYKYTIDDYKEELIKWAEEGRDILFGSSKDSNKKACLKNVNFGNIRNVKILLNNFFLKYNRLYVEEVSLYQFFLLEIVRLYDPENYNRINSKRLQFFFRQIYPQTEPIISSGSSMEEVIKLLEDSVNKVKVQENRIRQLNIDKYFDFSKNDIYIYADEKLNLLALDIVRFEEGIKGIYVRKHPALLEWLKADKEKFLKDGDTKYIKSIIEVYLNGRREKEVGKSTDILYLVIAPWINYLIEDCKIEKELILDVFQNVRNNDGFLVEILFDLFYVKDSKFPKSLKQKLSVFSLIKGVVVKIITQQAVFEESHIFAINSFSFACNLDGKQIEYKEFFKKNITYYQRNFVEIIKWIKSNHMPYDTIYPGYEGYANRIFIDTENYILAKQDTDLIGAGIHNDFVDVLGNAISIKDKDKKLLDKIDANN